MKILENNQNQQQNVENLNNYSAEILQISQYIVQKVLKIGSGNDVLISINTYLKKFICLQPRTINSYTKQSGKTDHSEIERTYNIRKHRLGFIGLFMRTNGKCNNSHTP